MWLLLIPYLLIIIFPEFSMCQIRGCGCGIQKRADVLFSHLLSRFHFFLHFAACLLAIQKVRKFLFLFFLFLL